MVMPILTLGSNIEALWLVHRGQEIALDVARGIHALHARKIVHFDIKSPNILLTRECLAKIADVGEHSRNELCPSASGRGHAFNVAR